jgi:hypothetical protein
VKGKYRQALFLLEKQEYELALRDVEDILKMNIQDEAELR